jgi:hypothetical protein
MVQALYSNVREMKEKSVGKSGDTNQASSASMRRSCASSELPDLKPPDLKLPSRSSMGKGASRSPRLETISEAPTDENIEGSVAEMTHEVPIPEGVNEVRSLDFTTAKPEPETEDGRTVGLELPESRTSPTESEAMKKQISAKSTCSEDDSWSAVSDPDASGCRSGDVPTGPCRRSNPDDSHDDLEDSNPERDLVADSAVASPANSNPEVTSEP